MIANFTIMISSRDSFSSAQIALKGLADLFPSSISVSQDHRCNQHGKYRDEHQHEDFGGHGNVYKRFSDLHESCGTLIAGGRKQKCPNATLVVLGRSFSQCARPEQEGRRPYVKDLTTRRGAARSDTRLSFRFNRRRITCARLYVRHCSN
jgi:hypothetical protein